MNMHIKILTLLFALSWGNLSATYAFNNAENYSIINSAHLATGLPCEEPAPANFHVTDVFTDEIRVAWDPPSVIPFQYNIKVFEVSSGNLIQNFNIPGTLTIARAVNLQPGTGYDIINTPVCPDGTLSPYFSSARAYTPIIELVESGFSLPTLPTPSCTIHLLNQFCYQDPSVGYTVVFKIQPTGSLTAGRFFGVYNSDDNCETTKLKVYPGLSPYQFYCTQSGPPCFTNIVTIKLNGSTIAGFRTGLNTVNGSQVLVCTQDVQTGYEIVRVTEAYGIQDSWGGECTPVPVRERSGKKDFEPVAQDSNGFSLTATPNPFTNQLEIRLPFANTTENTTLSLYDLQGRQILTQQTSGDRQTILLNTEQLTPGMYFLRAESGGIVQTVKVVKTL